MKHDKHLVLNEYKCLFVSPDGQYSTRGNNGNIGVPKGIFEEIEAFVLQSKNDECYVLQPCYKKGLGKVLQAQQFVGVIQTKSGTAIEILPKITEVHNEADRQRTRVVFLKMLSTLKNSPFLKLDFAHLKIQKYHMLEIFITLYLQELTALIKQGIRQNYSPVVENSPFLKGKLKTKEHLKLNSVHKERFFVEYDQFSADIPENRLIKKTLEYLYCLSRSWTNQQRIREFLFVFDQVPVSTNVTKDFSQVHPSRQMQYYQLTIYWCRIFLQQQSFTTFKGDSLAFAILFDMNRVFEDYVYTCLKRDSKYQDVQAQVATKHLVEIPKRYCLRPDLLIGKNIIADTKWKLIEDEKSISQADMYQMYVYAQKYDREEVWLVYPKSEKFYKSLDTQYYFDKEQAKSLRVLCFDCEAGRLIFS